MKKLLLMVMTLSFCSLLTFAVFAQTTYVDRATYHTKPVPKHHKVIEKPSSHPKTNEVCLSCIGSAQSK